MWLSAWGKKGAMTMRERGHITSLTAVHCYDCAILLVGTVVNLLLRLICKSDFP